MKRKFTAAMLAVSVALGVSGCSGGSIYSNYRDIGSLMVIQTVGFDSPESGGVTLSVSAEGSSSAGVDGDGQAAPVRLTADAPSVTLAQEKLQSFSDGRQLFFGHTSYIALGQSALETDVKKYFDCIERDSSFRLSIPVFAVKNDSAASLVLGSGGERADASRLLHAVAENVRLRGSAKVYTAAEIISSLDQNDSALIFAVRTVEAEDSNEGSEPDEKAVEPDGYIIIYNGKMAGTIPAELSGGVSILRGDTGTLPVSLGNATVELDKTSRTLSPEFKAGRLAGLKIEIRVSASLAEAEGRFSPDELEAKLEETVRAWVEGAIACSISAGCDALHLGSALERQHPKTLRSLGKSFALYMPELYYNVEVEAELDRSYHLDLQEGRQ